MTMIRIDGSRGEGGGQVLRSALGLSIATGVPFEIHSIRAGRKKPGLMRQHLAAVRAAAQVSSADVVGDALGSTALRFRPEPVRAGEFHFAVGSAGSTTLVLQTILPGLWSADGESVVHVEGGTHNPLAPPFDFLASAFLPVLGRMGPRVEAELHRPGFFPAGGGEVRVRVTPAERLEPLEILERGAAVGRRAVVHLSSLPSDIADRELDVVRELLGWSPRDCVVLQAEDPSGPGNVVSLELHHENVSEVATGFGAKHRSAERVARGVVHELRRYIASDAPVGVHLADQLLLPLAMAGGGAFRTLPLSGHTRTNAALIEEFLPVRFAFEEAKDGSREVLVRVVPSP